MSRTVLAAVVGLTVLSGCEVIAPKPDPIYVTKWIFCPEGDAPVLYELPERVSLPPRPKRAADFDPAWRKVEKNIDTFNRTLETRHRAFTTRYDAHGDATDECRRRVRKMEE